MKNLYRVVMFLFLITVFVVWASQLKADYTLVMIDLHSDRNFGYERFIAYSDCRKRGLANQDMLSSYTKTGFMCYKIEEGS